MADVIAQDCFARLRFRAEAAVKLTDEEDLTSVDELKELDEKRVDRIVSRIIKPGGRQGGRANAGIAVSERATHNLTVAAHLARMWDRCQRPHTMADIDLDDTFDNAKCQMVLEAKHKRTIPRCVFPTPIIN